MLIRRQLDVLMYLINSSESLHGKALSNVFHVNVRTLRSDVKKINDFLNRYDIKIDASNQFGYKISKENIAKFYQKDILSIIKSKESFEVPQTPNERISYMFFLLSNGTGYQIEELAELLYVSIASIYNDLHVVKRFTEKRFKGLRLLNENGKVELKGEEYAKRNLLSGIVTQRYHHLLEQKYSEYINPTGVFLETMYRIIDALTIHKDEFPFILTGESLYSFASDISLCVERERKGLLLEYSVFELDSTFASVKTFLCDKIDCLRQLNMKNWCFLQARFHAKNFIKSQSISGYSKFANLLKYYHEELSTSFNTNLFKDEKSLEYMKCFLEFFFLNEKKDYYWIEDDKYEIMINNPMCYVLSIHLSYCIYKKTSSHFNTTYLSKCSLVFEESYLRNERKQKGLLITNKDKEHIMCLLHKLVKYFGNSVDILEYGTLYDVMFGTIDLENYNVIISTEVLDHMDKKDYIKISSLCTTKDIAKISEYIDVITKKKAMKNFDVSILHLHNSSEKLKDCIIDLINSSNDLTWLDNALWNDWELEELFFIKKEESSLFLITPFIRTKETRILHVLPEHPVYFKKGLVSNIKLLVFKSADLFVLNDIVNK